MDQSTFRELGETAPVDLDKEVRWSAMETHNMNTSKITAVAILRRRQDSVAMYGFLAIIVFGIMGCSPATPPKTETDGAVKAATSEKNQNPPPKNEIDGAVNWWLSVHYVDSYEPNRRTNYFESYAIANTYSERKAELIVDGRPQINFIYDFAAQVPAAAGMWDGDRSKPIAWKKPNGRYNLASDETPTNDVRLFKVEGSVTLTQKGKAWYYSDTKR